MATQEIGLTSAAAEHQYAIIASVDISNSGKNDSSSNYALYAHTRTQITSARIKRLDQLAK